MDEIKYTHFRFGVGCHDLNGFWYSNFLMTFDDPETLQKQWNVWKKLAEHMDKDPNDQREMLIDQYDDKNGDLYDTIVIPSKYADGIQKKIFGDRYEEIGFNIFDESIKPDTIADVIEKIKLGKEELPEGMTLESLGI